MNDAIGLLDFPADPEERRRLGERGMLIEHALPNDDIDEAGLVFEREKGNSRRRAGPLPADHHTDVSKRIAVCAVLHLDGGWNTT
jgi:hypothetical protein